MRIIPSKRLKHKMENYAKIGAAVHIFNGFNNVFGLIFPYPNVERAKNHTAFFLKVIGCAIINLSFFRSQDFSLDVLKGYKQLIFALGFFFHIKIKAITFQKFLCCSRIVNRVGCMKVRILSQSFHLFH